MMKLFSDNPVIEASKVFGGNCTLPLDRSIQLMLGVWEQYFSSLPFCLTERASQRCASALCVIWCRNNNRNCMTRNVMYMDRTFCLSWLPKAIGKVFKCLFDRISNPLERKTLYVPLLLCLL